VKGRRIFLSLSTIISLSHAEGIELGNDWKLSGDIRTGWVQYDYDNTDNTPATNKNHKDSEGWYLIPKLSITSPVYNGFSGKITGAAVTDFGLNNEADESRTFAYNPQEGSYAILQEAFIQYNDKNNHALIGRNEFSSPMIDTDDFYLLADSFELADYAYKGFDNTVLGGGYVYKMAGVWDSGDSDNVGTTFVSMSNASYVSQQDKDNANDAGVWYVHGDYDDKTNQVKAWNYYATDLYNTFFLQYDFLNTADSLNYDFGLQIIDFQQVGKLADNNFTHIDYSMYSAKLDGTFDNGVGFATGVTKYTNGEGQGATLGAWGGYDYYFANGMVFHFFEAGSLQNATSYKLQGSYDFSKMGIAGLKATLRFTHFDLDSQYSKSTTGLGQNSMDLQGLRINYSFLGGGYFTGTYEQGQISHENDTYALRLIGGYKF
jgi:hypothetical protein